MHAHRVTVYGVGVESMYVRGASVVRPQAHRNLKRIVDETGGGYIELSKHADMKAAIDRMLEQLRGPYLLTFAPPIWDAKKQKLEVTTTRPGVSVRAAKGYVSRSH